MEGLPLGRISALVPEFAVKDLPLGRTLMMITLISFLLSFFLSHIADYGAEVTTYFLINVEFA